MKNEKIKLKEKNKFTQLNLHGQEKDYMMRIKEKTKNGFTLVELLAVIVILAIILVIAVPKVMSVIEDAKKATLESTAKMIASQAEKQKVQNTVLGKTEEITCESVTKINDVDYAYCSIKFDNNIAKVSIKGSGKFDGLNICRATKGSAKTQTDECIIYGDFDVDGKVTENDIEIGKKLANKAMIPSPTQEITADVNGDGIINNRDITLIKQYVYGYISKFPIEDVIYGDVDGDGEVTQNDVEIVMEFIAGTKTHTPLQKKAADVNGNGKIDALDARLIHLRVNGDANKFPAEE